VIVKEGNKYIVKDSKGIKIFDTHDNLEKAKRQLAAIEVSKKKQAAKKAWE